MRTKGASHEVIIATFEDYRPGDTMGGIVDWEGKYHPTQTATVIREASMAEWYAEVETHATVPITVNHDAKFYEVVLDPTHEAKSA